MPEARASRTAQISSGPLAARVMGVFTVVMRNLQSCVVPVPHHDGPRKLLPHSSLSLSPHFTWPGARAAGRLGGFAALRLAGSLTPKSNKNASRCASGR